MAFKRTSKEQIDSGKKEMPRKLAFLGEMKVEFVSFSHDDDTGEATVELTATAVKALARKGAELKELKSRQKDLLKQAAMVPALEVDREQLTALRETAAATGEELRKAQRRIKALEKDLGIEPGAKVSKKPARSSTQAPGEAHGEAAALPPGEG